MQVPASQPLFKPVVQALQVVWGLPQAAVVLPGTQLLPLQQPAQLAWSHTQVLLWHF
jgi:hypothetical protein